MRKYKKEDKFLKYEDRQYDKKFRGKLDFSLYDMESVWDDTYGHVGPINTRPYR